MYDVSDPYGFRYTDEEAKEAVEFIKDLWVQDLIRWEGKSLSKQSFEEIMEVVLDALSERLE